MEYYGLSALGTAHLNVNGGINAVSTGTMYPYGEDGVDVGTEYKFTNQRRDPNGIDHFSAPKAKLLGTPRMRSYAAPLGRWLTPDPAGRAAVDPNQPQTWNRYAYMANHPMAAADPFGLAPGDLTYCGTSAGYVFCNAEAVNVTASMPSTDNGFDPPYVYFPPNNHPTGGGGGGSIGSAAPSAAPAHKSRSQCAAEFGDKYSIAGVLGVSDKSAGGYLVGAVAGNTISSLVEHFQSSPGKLYGDLALGGLGQGIPTGALAGDGVIGTAAGKIGAAVARSRALLSIAGDAAEVGAEDSLAGPLGIAKLAFDLGVFGLGYYLCPK